MDARTKQRIALILIQEVVLDRDDRTNEALVTIHWNGGRQIIVNCASLAGVPDDTRRITNEALQALRKLGGQLPDREPAVTISTTRHRSDHSSRR